MKKRPEKCRQGGEAVLRAQIRELRVQLREVNETLEAIRSGGVDALVVSAPEGDRIYTLRSAEQVYRVLVEQMEEGAATCLHDGTVLYSNRRLAHMLKMPMERLVGMNVQVLVAPGERPGLANMLHNLETGLLVFARAEFTLQAADGAAVPAQLAINMIQPEGAPIFCLVASDMTERKAAEEALRRSRDELEHRVLERTAELQAANEELEVNAEELRRSNEELKSFAYVASHDLQEPLRMVSGFLQLLQRQYGVHLDAKGNEYIGFAVDGAQRMSQLITDLLAYSRVERMGQPFKPTDAQQALTHALAALRAGIEEAGAAITHDDLPTVGADPTQLVQLLQNLIGNAIKFRHPERSCRVHIGAKLQDGQWIFWVRDNGIGIDPKQHERVFVIFQRLHTREKYPGTGIGLAICKKIVERHGGRIWAESNPGEGSTFCFTMPA